MCARCGAGIPFRWAAASRMGRVGGWFGHRVIPGAGAATLMGDLSVCEFARKALFPTFQPFALCPFRQISRRIKSLAGLRIMSQSKIDKEIRN